LSEDDEAAGAAAGAGAAGAEAAAGAADSLDPELAGVAAPSADAPLPDLDDE